MIFKPPVSGKRRLALLLMLDKKEFSIIGIRETYDKSARTYSENNLHDLASSLVKEGYLLKEDDPGRRRWCRHKYVWNEDRRDELNLVKRMLIEELSE